jgi:hypothetical protein
MFSNTELFANCQHRYDHSLIQHYRKSFYGQIHHSKKVDSAAAAPSEKKRLTASKALTSPRFDQAVTDRLVRPR